MTGPIKSSDGIFYAGMQRVEVEKQTANAKDIVIRFDNLDDNKDNVLSEKEILQERDNKSSKLDLAGIITSVLSTGILVAGISALVTTSAVALPVIAVVAGIAGKITGECLKSSANDIDKETQQYLDQKEAIAEPKDTVEAKAPEDIKE